MAERKVFHDSVVALPEQPGLTAAGLMQHAAVAHDRESRLDLHFVLGPSRARLAELRATVEAGGTHSEDEQQAFGADEAAVRGLTDWLGQEGYEIEEVTGDGASVYASAPLDAIESSLGVRLVPVTSEGLAYIAAKDAPSLPGEVAGDAVQAIIGLQPYRSLRKHLRPGPLTRAARAAQDAAAAAREHGYLVADILEAYGAQNVPATGAGETIAILIDTLPDDDDLQAFWRANGLPDDLGRVTKIQLGQGPLPPLSGEESLDAQWTSGIAPGADIRIYATGSLQLVAIDRALDAILADVKRLGNIRQVSISLGLGETYYGPASAEIATQHAIFVQLAGAGVNVFVSSGDAGSNPGPTGHDSTGPTQVEYQSSDPCVVGVGGTTLRLDANGAVSAETAWSGSGGGKSLVFPRPAWQAGDGVPAGPQRLVPDVSLAADPATGGMIVLNGRPGSVGGTSWSAPVCAGLCARLNEARHNAGKPFVGFLNPLLYPLAGTAAFRDVTHGTNGAFSARPGYDMVTGLGTPNLGELIAALG